MTKFIDLSGQKFGRLTVLSFSHKIKNKRYYWNCLCNCGIKKLVCRDHLVGGRTKSCGCLIKEISRKIHTKHGKHGTKVYNTYNSMIRRCTDIKEKSYPRYGGRGITVCKRWLDSFNNFYEDMGEPPTEKHSIDRINNNGNYEKENCKWSTHIEQCNNRRTNHVIEFNGNKINIKKLSEITKIPYSRLLSRIKSGLNIELSVNKPYRKTSSPHKITFNGEVKSLKEWSNTLNIKHSVLYERIFKQKWSVERAFTESVN